MRMWGLFALGFGALFALLKGKSMSDGKVVVSPKVESLRMWTIPLSMVTGIPADFILAWIQVESGGNACAIGKPGAKGPDGHPQEQGFVQLYNPDDLKRFKVAPGELRVYCRPGTGQLLRNLKPEEVARQMELAYKLVGWHREKADEAMRKAGVTWSGKDYWRCVKLDHALPGLCRTGLARTRQALGRAPKDWWEFKAAVLSNRFKLDANTEAYRASFAKWFTNAEKVGDHAPDGKAKGDV